MQCASPTSVRPIHHPLAGVQRPYASGVDYDKETATSKDTPMDLRYPGTGPREENFFQMLRRYPGPKMIPCPDVPGSLHHGMPSDEGEAVADRHRRELQFLRCSGDGRAGGSSTPMDAFAFMAAVVLCDPSRSLVVRAPNYPATTGATSLVNWWLTYVCVVC